MGIAQPVQTMQRSRGAAHIGLGGARSLVTALRQQGCAKVILHNAPNRWPEAVFLNTSGGLTGGDDLSYSASLGTGTKAVVTTQTAERAYRSTDGAAQMRVALQVGAGGFLDWLPQETILFDGAALERRTELSLAEGAGALMLETIVLGRAAMGETLARIRLRDWRVVERAGAPVWLEPLALDNRALNTGPAGLDGQRAFATLALITPEAEAQLAPLRRVLDQPGVVAAASALPGRLILRAHAADAWPLRQQIARALSVLRPNRALPRVWQM